MGGLKEVKMVSSSVIMDLNDRPVNSIIERPCYVLCVRYATQQGKTKIGNSNKDVRGSHDKNASKAKKNDHEAADARSAREQAAADQKKN
ncbi:hypothetical protein SAMN05518672_1159 [Chitinophaga sp. CF118]|nr:hypothetical protein SAMN05518672_1159 [Chitinophaga sp. CF118]